MYKIESFSKYCIFVKKWHNHYAKLQKIWKFENLHFLFLMIFPILFELQRYTVPHFKALSKLFWPLAWVLTLGAIIFALLRKMSVYFFFTHTLALDFEYPGGLESQIFVLNPQVSKRSSVGRYCLVNHISWAKICWNKYK